MLTFEKNFILKKTFYDLKSESQKSYGGFLWHLIAPSSYILIFYLAFNSGFSGRPDSFFSFVIVGVMFYRMVILALSEALTVIENNMWLLNFYDFPKVLLFLSRFILSFTKFLFFAIFAFIIIFYLNDFNLLTIFRLTLVFILNIFFLFSLFVILACLAPLIKDISAIWEIITLGLLFTSGVFVDINSYNTLIQDILWLNPLAIFIDFYRKILIYQLPFPNDKLFYIITFTILQILLSFFVYKKLNKLFLKITW